MQIDKLYTFVNEWNIYRMSFMVDLRIDLRTKEMLSITPSQKDLFYICLALSLSILASDSKLRHFTKAKLSTLSISRMRTMAIETQVSTSRFKLYTS